MSFHYLNIKNYAGALSQDEWEVSYLYLAFVLRKVLRKHNFTISHPGTNWNRIYLCAEMLSFRSGALHPPSAGSARLTEGRRSLQRRTHLRLANQASPSMCHHRRSAAPTWEARPCRIFGLWFEQSWLIFWTWPLHHSHGILAEYESWFICRLVSMFVFSWFASCFVKFECLARGYRSLGASVCIQWPALSWVL